ncbi:MAG TPA: hypothetical protein GX513_01085 [Firmicutes bacterium]|nr:hypothetical protein [Bacillota bacterium]
MDQVIARLLAAEPWVRYRTHLDLLRRSENDPEAAAAHREMLAHAKVKTLIMERAAWPAC